MIVVVSDVHLAEMTKDSEVDRNVDLEGRLSEDDRQFLDFLRYIKTHQLREGGDLVLLGDVVDLWRRDFAKALRECSVIFSELMDFESNKVKIHYVVGNHDYYMLKLRNNLFKGTHFCNVAKSVRLSSGDKSFFFIHGYQLETLANPHYKSQTTYEEFAEHLCLHGDDIGHAADEVWNLWSRLTIWWKVYRKLASVKKNTSALSLRRRPKDVTGALRSMMEKPGERLIGRNQAGSMIEMLAGSDARSVYLGIEGGEVLVFGHTHKPYQCPPENDVGNVKVVNTGSWKKSPCGYYSFVVIDEGRVHFHEFKDGEILERSVMDFKRPCKLDPSCF